MPNFGIFQPIWLKFGMESLNGRTQHMYVIYLRLSILTSQTNLPVPPNQLTGLKVKNLHKLAIFQPIWLKLGLESLDGRTQHMYVIYMHLSMLTDQTGLPPKQPTGLRFKNSHNFDIFQPIRLKLGMGSLKVLMSNSMMSYVLLTF